MNSNITDFFRDPRLDNLDDPQQGAPQLDDLMDPVQPGPGKAPNKMARFWSGSLAASSTVLVPDGVTTFLKIVPEYWIIRVSSAGANVTTPLLVSRQGGDDLKVMLGAAITGSGGVGDTGIGIEKRIILPGPSTWLRFTTGSSGGTLYYMVCAMIGYNPNEIF